MFIDEAEITVRSGKGGDGVVHFRREKYVPFGGPDGGDGGRGGDVILEVAPTLNTLFSFRHQTYFKAQDGTNGARQKMSGRSGADLVIPVPPGTLVLRADTLDVLGDLVSAGQRLVAVKGGRGGRGNQHFANARRQAPRIAEKGEPAQEVRLKLELKLIADIGIVGVPNAGKSTFLAAVTNAKPKIAPYPFTTVEPNLGVAELDDGSTLVLADIPGLLEGAHSGVGLGHDFLRHIQRTRVLIHLLDGLAKDILADLAQTNSELALFDPALGRKPQVVALNKMDLPMVAKRWLAIAAGLRKRGIEPIPISAITGDNVRSLLRQAYLLLQETPADAPDETIPVYRLESDPHAFTIQKTNEGWRVKCDSIERAAEMTYWEYDQSVRRFQQLLQKVGVEDALRKAGILPGETVFIGEYELEWQD
jgi:GTP-binding protein